MLGLFDERVAKANQTSDWSMSELTYEQVEYAALDAVAVMRVAEKLAAVVSGYKMQRYYKLCKEAQHPIACMQLNGINVDVPHHRELIDTWTLDLNTARKEVIKVLGQDKISAHTIAGMARR